MKRAYTYALIAICAVASSFTMNAINGFPAGTSVEQELLPDGGAYADRHVERGLLLLREGTLGDEREPFLGGFARGPIEAGFIALAFLLFGERMWSLWALQMLFFVFACWFLYGVSIRYLGERWGLAPALMLALFWGSSLYVFNINNEIWSLFFITGAGYALVRWYESGSVRWLGVAGCALSLLVLAKPIFEYMLPVAVVLIFLHATYSGGRWRQAVIPTLVFTGMLVLLVGGWHVRNVLVLGTYKISAGGHALLIRAKTAEYPPRVAAGFFVSSVFGDYVADKIFPGFADLNEPRETIREIFNRRRPELRIAGMTEFETDELFFKEASGIIRAHPIGYFAVAPAWFFRLNSPPRYNGGMMERLFVDTYQEIPASIKIMGLLSVHLVWLAFVGAVFWKGFYWLTGMRRRASFEAWVVLFIGYTNAAYALLAHAEVRYLLVVMPFYFLLFTIFLKDRVEWVIAKKQIIAL